MIEASKLHWTKFRTGDDGAVTVDWVVLVSAIVGMSIVLLATIWQGAFAYTLRLNDEVEQIDVMDYTEGV